MQLCTYEKNLINHIKRNKNKPNFFTCSIENVSQSGMTRHIKVGCVYKGEFVNVTPLLKKLACQKWSNKYDGYKIGDCGMDMIFATLQVLGYYLGIERPEKFAAFQHYGRF